MDLSLHPRDLLRVLWRRKWFFVVPGTIVGVAALALAFLLPPTYRSEATILIEEQEIPDDLVPSLVTDYIDRRLDVLTRRILVTGNLMRIAENFELYPDEREIMTRTDLAERMRDDIDTSIISTEVNDPSGGRANDMTVAFEIAFEYRDPVKARRVTDELASLYLSTNLETRRTIANQTMNFFASARDQIEERIARLEENLTDFKVENREFLPEEVAFARQQLANYEQQLQTLERDLRSLRERQGFLSTQLALTEEFEPPELAGGTGTTPESQLELLRAELATARARYSANHPDVRRLEREVRSLRATVGERSGAVALRDRDSALVAELASLRERYTPEHPDVRRVERELASVRAELGRAEDAGASASTAGLARNSAYVELSAQLNSVESEIRAIEEQRAQVMGDRVELQEMLARAPVVERQYLRLQRELESAIADRDALAEKEATAQLSGALEAEAVSERLVLADSAMIPTDPIRPNKKLILGLGLILAVSSSGFSVFLAESLDRSVRSVRELGRLLGDTPLAAIPTIVSPAQKRRIWLGRLAALGGVVVLVAGGLTWMHHRVVPLDVLMYQAQTSVEGWMTTTFPDAPAPAGAE